MTHHTTTTILRRTASVLAASALALGVTAGLGGAPAQAFDSGHTIMQGSQAPMGQTNGPVWTLEMTGNRIYAGGGFTSTRPYQADAGNGETGQGYLAAFDEATGAPITGFAPQLTNDYNGRAGVVRASVLTPDGSQLIVGGDFNLVDGKRANYLARFDAATGRFLGQVGNNGVNGPVSALAVSPDGSTLYVGGRFNKAGWTNRTNVAAISLTNKATLAWAPTVSNPTRNEPLRVTALAVSSDNQRVFVGGPFQTVNGQSQQGFAATNAADGSLAAGFRNNYLYAPYSWGTTLEVVGNDLYLGARDDFTGGSVFYNRTEGVQNIDATTGVRKWFANCYGDTFALQVVGDDVYVASHAHDCSRAGGMPETNPRTELAIHALNRATGVVRPYFVQTSGRTDTPNTTLLSRALASDGTQLVMGGGFMRVNGNAQANVVRFEAGSSAPDKPAYINQVSPVGNGSVDLSVRLGSDRDDVNLTYEVYRNASSTSPIATVTRESVLWRKEFFTVRDSGLTPGQTIFYRVKAIDPSGAFTWSVRSATVTVG